MEWNSSIITALLGMNKPLKVSKAVVGLCHGSVCWPQPYTDKTSTLFPWVVPVEYKWWRFFFLPWQNPTGPWGKNASNQHLFCKQRQIEKNVYYTVILLRNVNWQTLLSVSDLHNLPFLPLLGEWQQELDTDEHRKTDSYDSVFTSQHVSSLHGAEEGKETKTREEEGKKSQRGWDRREEKDEKR